MQVTQTGYLNSLKFLFDKALVIATEKNAPIPRKVAAIAAVQEMREKLVKLYGPGKEPREALLAMSEFLKGEA